MYLEVTQVRETDDPSESALGIRVRSRGADQVIPAAVRGYQESTRRNCVAQLSLSQDVASRVIVREPGKCKVARPRNRAGNPVIVAVDIRIIASAIGVQLVSDEPGDQILLYCVDGPQERDYVVCCDQRIVFGINKKIISTEIFREQVLVPKRQAPWVGRGQPYQHGHVASVLLWSFGEDEYVHLERHRAVFLNRTLRIFAILGPIVRDSNQDPHFSPRN